MKILLVFTGGTIGSKTSNKVISPNSESINTLLCKCTEMHKDISIETVCPYTILSENLCAENLFVLYNCISSYNFDDYDGIIVTHGTDTLQYTSAFLGYVFAQIKIPIVVVSANYPLEDKRSNGFSNFSSAIQFIAERCGCGVFVSYTNKGENTKFHRATRLLQHMAYSDDVFSVFDEYYAEISENKVKKNQSFSFYEDEIKISLPCNIDELTRVSRVLPYVGMQYPIINSNTKAVLFESYHSGTLNTNSVELQDFCTRAEKLKVPLFLTGACEGFNYESKLMLDRLNIRVLPSASPIAMYIKLCLLDEGHINNVLKPCAEDFVQR